VHRTLFIARLCDEERAAEWRRAKRYIFKDDEGSREAVMPLAKTPVEEEGDGGGPTFQERGGAEID
jgi:hypothetical protein